MPIGNSNIGSGNLGSGGINSSIAIVSDFLFKYLPKFVERNDFLNEMILRIATALTVLRRNIYGLETMVTSGASGKRYAEINHLLLSGYENDVTLRNDIVGMLAIHESRGTASGILADVKRLCNDPGATITYYSGEETGWWTELTYADVDLNDNVDLSEMLALIDNVAFIQINCTNLSLRTNGYIIEKIRREIVPINIEFQIIFN